MNAQEYRNNAKKTCGVTSVFPLAFESNVLRDLPGHTPIDLGS